LIVIFTITVTNEGNVDAYAIDLADNIPTGLTLTDANWTDVGGIADLNTPIAGPLAPGASTSVDITFVIDVGFMGTSITNSAEITDADNDEDPDNDPPEDTDSDPDNDDGDQSEDDEDPETIPVEQIFDLALIKTIDPSQTVYNQGTLDAYNIEVVDYLPAGLALADATWSPGANAGEVFQTIAGPLVPGDSLMLPITLQITTATSGGDTQNFSEISEADNDTDPTNDPPEDIDSEPDNEPDNDGDFTDNDTDNTNGDEDDHDPEDFFIELFDLALDKAIATNQTLPVFGGDPVTFTITIFNQGNVDAYNIDLADNIPTGLILADANWTDNGGIADLNTSIPGQRSAGRHRFRPG